MSARSVLRIATTAFACRTAATRFSKSAVRRLAIGGGGGTALGISLFGGAKDNSTKNVTDQLKLIHEVDTLYEAYLIDNAFAILRRYENNCTDAELLWRVARVLFEKSKLSTDANEKKSLVYRAYEAVKKAVENEPISGSFGAHKWLAIIVDAVGEVEGTKSRIAKSYEMKEHLEKALAINPTDATTWHILGLWHFAFADMPGYQRAIASALFGRPPSSTYEEALKYFQKAETLQPGFYSQNSLHLGIVYQRLGNRAEAEKFLRAAFKAGIVSADDKKAHDESHNLLRKMGIKDADLLK